MHSTLDMSGYRYRDEPIQAHSYLLPEVSHIIAEITGGQRTRVFDLGCGNGDFAAGLMSDGHELCGVDPSREGIALARKNHPELRLGHGSAYDDLASRFGTFPVVVSINVVEHVYAPKVFAKTVYSLVCDGGAAIVSAPFHGYWKNLAMALSGSMDRHFAALWDHGRIKFWSEETLCVLLREAGFEAMEFRRVGRVSPLAKVVIAIARK